jgi:hypothetical protein
VASLEALEASAAESVEESEVESGWGLHKVKEIIVGRAVEWEDTNFEGGQLIINNRI